MLRGVVMSACSPHCSPVRHRVDGAPFQVGDRVVVVDAVDRDIFDLSAYVGRGGVVEYLEYSCGCGQHYPDDPMVGIRLAGEVIDFWKEEISLSSPGGAR